MILLLATLAWSGDTDEEEAAEEAAEEADVLLEEYAQQIKELPEEEQEEQQVILQEQLKSHQEVQEAREEVKSLQQKTDSVHDEMDALKRFLKDKIALKEDPTATLCCSLVEQPPLEVYEMEGAPVSFVSKPGEEDPLWDVLLESPMHEDHRDESGMETVPVP